MNVNLGFVTPGSTIYLPWNTFNSSGASVTLSGLAVGDIKIYKNGSTTERSSTSGYTLLDTDGIDFDGLTGIHGISIDLADNTDAGFYTAGAHYVVVVSTVTVDGQTVSFVAGTFRIGYANARLNTTIATLYSQSIFDLTAGPSENSALTGMEIIIHDAANAAQFTTVIVNTYTGSSKNIVLAGGSTPIFTIAAGDNVSVMGPAPLRPVVAGRNIAIDSANQVSVGTMANDSITAAAIASDAGTELAAAIWNALTSGISTANSIGKRIVDYLTGDIYARLGAPAGASVSADIAAVKAETATIVGQTGTSGVLLADSEDVYIPQIRFDRDDTNGKDEYTIQWFRNGTPVTSGITVPLIQVTNRDGTDLIASTAMTQIGSTGAYKYDESTNRIDDGEAVLINISATINGSSRTFRRLEGRDQTN